MDIEIVNQQSPLLGRQKVHDERSRSFSMAAIIDRKTWKDKKIRLYDPIPNPNQRVGCCTGVAKCSQLNSVGNRVKGRFLDMISAELIYSKSSEIDPWEGSWLPTDTGSSGLASAKTAVIFGIAGEYRWLFNGANEVVQNVVEGRVISVGTYWYSDMFNLDKNNKVSVSGEMVGGHQYVIRGYDLERDWVLGRCWWGEFRDFWMSRNDLDVLLRNGGDAHFQHSILTSK